MNFFNDAPVAAIFEQLNFSLIQYTLINAQNVNRIVLKRINRSTRCITFYIPHGGYLAANNCSYFQWKASHFFRESFGISDFDNDFILIFSGGLIFDKSPVK